MDGVIAYTSRLVQRIREEFEEAPGLQITVDEGARFWALDAEICAYVLERLYERGFLVRSPDGRYQQGGVA
jgi:beta-phosphoglucomutase-like phosphatase (HAD superfamily)